MEKKGSLGGDTGGTGGECCGYKTDGMLYIRDVIINWYNLKAHHRLIYFLSQCRNGD